MKQTSSSKVSVFDSRVVLGSVDSNQNEDVRKSFNKIEKFDFMINLLKDRISLSEQHLIEKKCNNRFFCKTEDIAHSNIFRATYSDNNDNNESIKDSSKSVNKNRQSTKNNPLTEKV